MHQNWCIAGKTGMSCLQAKLPRGLESVLAVHIMLNAASFVLLVHFTTAQNIPD
jgi:hypothetical protein